VVRWPRLIGEILGDYKLVSPLAPGGVGDVYVGEHKELGTKAAVEVMAKQAMENVQALQRYLHVIRVTSRVKHPGTFKVEDAGIDAAGRGYIVRELIDTDPLSKRIQSLGRLSLTQIGEIGKQIASVMAAMHDEHIVHGDLRPDVVLLLPQGGLSRGEPVKVTELGVADLKRALGIPIGPVYTAPELLGSGEPIDWRVDAYGLGCVVFEMATGRPPYLGSSAEEVRQKHLEAVPPAARSLMPDVAPSLDTLIGRLLSKKPDDRFGSMREILRAFEQMGGGSTRPLAPTASDMPAVVVGELQAQGEIQAKPAKEPETFMETSSIIAPTGSVTIERPQPAPHVSEATLSIPKRRGGGSKVGILIAVLLLLAAGGTALAFALR
jgi:serine/threonine protein kinase